MEDAHDRTYMQYRLREELGRGQRYHREFAVLVFEMAPSTDGLSERKKMRLALHAIGETVRPSDVIAHVYEDAIAVLLVETGARDANDALMRIRIKLAAAAGTWQVTVYHFPEHSDAIGRLPMLTAA